MSKSVKRVEKAIGELGLAVSVQRMPETTRTAQDAAVACGCEVGQIVKSMIFEGVETGKLKLLLVSGQHDVDLTEAPEPFVGLGAESDAARGERQHTVATTERMIVAGAVSQR